MSKDREMRTETGRRCPLCGKELELSDNGLWIVACPSCGEIGAFIKDCGIDDMRKWISLVSDEVIVARLVGRNDDLSRLSALCEKSPKFIAGVMSCIGDTTDTEYAHVTADKLMVILLRGQEYGEAMDIFEGMDKWYA